MSYQNEILEVNRNLELLAPKVQDLVAKAIAECHDNDLFVEVFEGWRSPERQAELYKSKKPTKAGSWLSFHQYGLSVDIAYKRPKWSWEGDFEAPKKIFMNYGFDAPPSFETGHFQISYGHSIHKIREVYMASGLQAVWIMLGVA